MPFLTHNKCDENKILALLWMGEWQGSIKELIKQRRLNLSLQQVFCTAILVNSSCGREDIKFQIAVCSLILLLLPRTCLLLRVVVTMREEQQASPSRPIMSKVLSGGERGDPGHTIYMPIARRAQSVRHQDSGMRWNL